MPSPAATGRVYTPQIVVDGRWHVIGSDRAALEAAIAVAAVRPDVDVAVAMTGSTIQIEIGAAPPGGPTWGTVWIVLFDKVETISVGRGENAGQTLTYFNVVIEMHRLMMWRGDGMTIALPTAEMIEAKADGCVVLVQEEQGGLPGAIVGAAIYSAGYCFLEPRIAKPVGRGHVIVSAAIRRRLAIARWSAVSVTSRSHAKQTSRRDRAGGPGPGAGRQGLHAPGG